LGALPLITKEQEMENTPRKQLRRYFWIVGCLGTILMFSCSSNSPSESDGRKFLEGYYGKTEYAKVKSFSKTNEIDKPNGYFLNLRRTSNAYVTFNLATRSSPMISSSNCTKAGAVKKMSGSIRFEKTENGWREGRRLAQNSVAWVALCVDNGVTIIKPITATERGGMKGFYVEDPDGNIIGFGGRPAAS